jgi:CRISPR-associated protein Cmr6
MRAAIPNYLEKPLGGADLPPGHAFRLYYRGYDQNWQVEKTKKAEALANLVKLSRKIKEILTALVERQKHLAGTRGAWRISGWARAPFTAGLGNEHPLENGFSFLDPYGIPYYPGASVKGVVRRAAEELALVEPDSRGWTIPAVWWLFGFDFNAAFFRQVKSDTPAHVAGETKRWRTAYEKGIAGSGESEKRLFHLFVETTAGPEPEEREALHRALKEGSGEPLKKVHSRGALAFWDVIPKPDGDALRVDIMNPHFTHYYQKSDFPGDWGDPVPIFFLTLPENTELCFVVEFAPPVTWPEEVLRYFAESTASGPRWQALLQAAFEFAFEWLGFGAKTSIGYGRFQKERFKPPGPSKVSSEDLGQLKHPQGAKPTTKPPSRTLPSSSSAGGESRSPTPAAPRKLVNGTNPKTSGGQTPSSVPAASPQTPGAAPESGLKEKVRAFDFAKEGIRGLEALLEKIAALPDEQEKERLVGMLRVPNVALARMVFYKYPDLKKYWR